MGQFFWGKQGVGEYPNKDFFPESAECFAPLLLTKVFLVFSYVTHMANLPGKSIQVWKRVILYILFLYDLNMMQVPVNVNMMPHPTPTLSPT